MTSELRRQMREQLIRQGIALDPNATKVAGPSRAEGFTMSNNVPTGRDSGRQPDSKGGPGTLKSSPQAPTPKDKRPDKTEATKLKDDAEKKYSDKDSGYFQINDIVFTIPPEQINIQKEIKNVSIPILRSAQSQKVRTGHGFAQVNVPLTFTSLTDVNNQLVPLVYAVRRHPFVWVENKYLRKVLLPMGRSDYQNTKPAMLFAVQSVSVQTVENLPTTVQCFLQLLWFNYLPFTRDLQFRKDWLLDEEEQTLLDKELEFYGTGRDVRNAMERFRAESFKKLRNADTMTEKSKYYDELQIPVRDPRESEAWKEFIKGHSQYQLGRNHWGPDIDISQTFYLGYRKYYQGNNPPNSSYILEDPTYEVWYTEERFTATEQFNPIHVSIGFQNQIATLPLLEQQLPTAQFLGSSDRMITVTFFVTPAGQPLLKKLSAMIQEYENQVIEFRSYSKDMFMKLWNPLAFMCGLATVVPQQVTTETVPGSPGSSVVRVTFSEYSISPRPVYLNEAGKKDKILKAFIQAAFGELGDNANDVIMVDDVRRHNLDNAIELDLTPVGETAIQSVNVRDSALSKALGSPGAFSDVSHLYKYEKGGIPLKWLKMKLPKDAVEPDKADIWEFANQITQITQQRASGFAYASDEETYGLKVYAGLSLYQDPGKAEREELQDEAATLKEELKSAAKAALLGELGRSKFSKLAREYLDAGKDTDSCYPDLDLPPHPLDKSGSNLYVEPDFYIYNPDKVPYHSTHEQAKSEGEYYRVLFEQLIRDNSYFALEESGDQNAEEVIKEYTSLDYANSRDPKSVGSLTKSDHLKGATINNAYPFDSSKSEPTVGVSGELYTLTSKNIYNACIEDVRQNRELGMRKAFPTFRLYFIREGRDAVTYRGFHHAYGGYAVNEIRFISSRKIPADMCVITLANLDGFLETEEFDDIRPEDKQYLQDRLVTDSRNYLYDYDSYIRSKLEIWNNEWNSKVDEWTIRKLVEFIRNNPGVVAGGYGPMGVTLEAAEAATGKRYNPDKLAVLETNFNIGIGIVCRYAFDMKDYQSSDRYAEVIAALYVFPNLEGEIKEGVYRTSIRGKIQDYWYQDIADPQLHKLVNALRPQTSAMTQENKQKADKAIKNKENEIKDLENGLAGIEIRSRDIGYFQGPAVKDAYDTNEETIQLRNELEARLRVAKDALEKLKAERNRWVTRAPGGNIIFREGTDVVLRMGYSNNPENLEVVFVGHVTEAHPGPGTITLLCQTFATEFVQEIKGTDEDMTKEEGFVNLLPTVDVDGPLIAEWILTQKEVKHFGRWDNRAESPELEQRGSWTQGYFILDTVADDNVYLVDDPFFDMKGSRFTLNERTLWQALQDLTFRYPGYVLGVRPYKDQDWWRNTLFIGRPDFTYLSQTPEDIAEIILRMRNATKDKELPYLAGEFDAIADPASLATPSNKELEAELADISKQRRKPFRRYHLLSSYHDIIDNGIITTKRDTFNAVRLFGKGDSHVFEKTLDGIDEKDQRWLEVENDNALTGTFNSGLGQNMATSMLMWHLRDIYRGDITVLGDPTIRPYDICYLYDNYNDFSGPVEVEQVIHTLSPEVGFITQITPDLYVTISDLPTRTNLGALGVYGYRWLLNKEGVLKSKYEEVAGMYANQQNPTGAAIGLERVGGIQEVGPPPGEYPSLATSGSYYNETAGVVAGALTWTAIAGFAFLYPLWGLPLIAGAYFLGGYLKNHATIRIVPLMHKGHPFVTGLRGFRAPESMDIMMEQWRAWRKAVNQKWKATDDLIGDLGDKSKRDEIIRYRFPTLQHFLEQG